MAELTDIDGVGPSRAADLDDAGYTFVSDVAAADAEELAEELSISEDQASGIIESAADLLDDDLDVEDDVEESEESDSEADSEDDEDEDEEEAEEDSEDDVDEEEAEEDAPTGVSRFIDTDGEEAKYTYVFDDVDFEMFNHLYVATFNQRVRTRVGRRPTDSDALAEVQNQLLDQFGEDELELVLTEDQLNSFYTGLRFHYDEMRAHHDAYIPIVKPLVDGVAAFRMEHLYGQK